MNKDLTWLQKLIPVVALQEKIIALKEKMCMHAHFQAFEHESLFI